VLLPFPEALLRSCVAGVVFFLLLGAVAVEGFGAALWALAISGDIAIPKAITTIPIDPNFFMRWSTQVNSKSIKPIMRPHTPDQGNH
jgi:thiamine transporter ThiT